MSKINLDMKRHDKIQYEHDMIQFFLKEKFMSAHRTYIYNQESNPIPHILESKYIGMSPR